MFESGFKNVNINLTSANSRRTFSCGDIVTGTLSFDLTKETKITSITMALSGNVDVHWSSGSGGKKRHRRHFSAKINLFLLKSGLLLENSLGGGPTKLPPGTHVYPFTCHIPHGDFPSTFHGVHGKIQYLLTVSIDRPWHFAKSFETELNFLERINNKPELWAPLSGSNSMYVCCLCWASGPVELTATLERKAFMRGEIVKVICEINNASSRTVTPKARLKERQTYYTHGRHNRNSGTRNLVTQNGEAIKANSSDVHKELLLTIPTNTHLTISNCPILEVDYMIEVVVDVRGSSEVIVRCPIIIYDYNIYNQIPQQP
ncbi:arrestin domain-containing protein 3-like [Boleophthalmus pectinirostris]|uniref:arrestin domain-containing protein 3-like n=1 Tax=Boleophthalmus pectinirostris TaxID=150288 RepID=UPI000A1C4A6F|nr:arrestin domain-containing protein 3-like [Boleophthalmus pectinirostris]